MKESNVDEKPKIGDKLHRAIDEKPNEKAPSKSPSDNKIAELIDHSDVLI